jgi:hypothetical protein
VILMTIHEECDVLAKQIGFDDADAFLGYCVLHSMTERALFNGPQIGALQVMAGYEEIGRENMTFKDAWRSCDLRDLVAEARVRMDQTNVLGAGI